MSVTLSEPVRNHAAEIVATFSVLVHAWHTHDLSKAASSRADLERLGVLVEILPQAPSFERAAQ